MSSVSGTVALVTGASSGLGAEVAKLLASRGVSVFGVARDERRLAATFDSAPGGRFTVADIATAETCRSVVAQCVDAFGRLDTLINVAGFHRMRHTLDTTDEDWDHDLAVNLHGPFHLCRAALPHLLETAGNIVNVASIAGLEGQAYSAGYCAAKHGLVGLTRALAVEFTAERLRVNAVCPGGMLTPQITGFTLPEGADVNLVMRTASPRGLSDPGDVAKLVAFLAGDDAAAIHGAVYTADNGKTAG
ncbi:NAD(P)-dependent dehydrogenase (short-subunit alcohol dehydrogenase family) [Nocardia transvalensis]|uniref:NAD(P)-dependent dehydrogenase (Short-subunit alcohol dehydrogenase family) n=1 Tax=Nocardia transvalensis TaxID=37333 RepID=A0A7W9ULA6_9NOCA|nr:SDR family oxidoreductase [Nocardia transvalensis]MBB5917344.1 NAD(P)-dependent dehydrogenase (short-subunit alcohol dehydrogenase family) [Nocardia transvalensis]